MHTSILRVDFGKMGPGSFQCPVTALGALGTNWYSGPSEYEEEVLYCEAGRALKQPGLKDCGVSFSGDT